MPSIARTPCARDVRPIPPGRQPLVDVLRGLALLGILLVNIEFILQAGDLGNGSDSTVPSTKSCALW